ncbi:hypothetical protein AB0M02_10590 [Actinoplanes sp. NPDC051861]|uniref:hypothetical protein n=1 Tax=Actinoplanes sp. NPDC051861 TaxID=3155170 RepID=UPI003426C979
MRTLLAAATVLAVAGCTAAPPPPAPIPSPDIGQPVVLDARVAGWETSAWLGDGSLCVRGAGVDGNPEAASVFCDPAPATLNDGGKPLPYLAPADPQARQILLVGTVSGEVAEVSTTMFGETATGKVHPLPVTDGRSVGAYAVWLPSSGDNQPGMTLDDITAVVARDAAGNVVTRLP